MNLTLEAVPSSPGILGSWGTVTFMRHVLGTRCWAAFFYNHGQQWLSAGCLPGPALSTGRLVFVSTQRTALREKQLLFSSARALKHRLKGQNTFRITIFMQDVFGGLNAVLSGSISTCL